MGDAFCRDAPNDYDSYYSVSYALEEEKKHIFHNNAHNNVKKSVGRAVGGTRV